jgi:nicotinate-nucleotide adenylyltransferase
VRVNPRRFTRPRPLAERGWAGLRVGLLGGSFNPAHEGHRHLSLLALQLLDLDQVWWLVSPGNPLKPSRNMAPFEQRYESAKRKARHPRIVVSGIERDLGTRYTADTIPALQARFPQTRFVWLMGADNLAQLHRWQRWTSLFRSVPMAVFDRPPRGFHSLFSPAARRFARQRIDASNARRLAYAEPPAWVFFASKQNPLSATALRRAGGWLRIDEGIPTLDEYGS